ncbi:MAG: tetratricopeptide repeat protein [Desulfuromonas sp.]|nr:tetratricopeptide repeat protein [Desulfuromonas sp.]
MRDPGILQALGPNGLSRALARLGRRSLCLIIAVMLVCGCSQGFQARSNFEEANVFFSQGSYEASLQKYEQIIETYPATGDRALFEMGIIYTHPRNEQKDYRKAQECFQKLIKDYPGSRYRQDSEMMLFYLNNVSAKDQLISTQQAHIETLRQEIKGKEGEIAGLKNEIVTLQKKAGELEQQVFSFAIQSRPTDKILIEKKERRLTLLSKGEALKTYRIALGGNPIGPKERQGDNKTPEGIYFIDAKNQGSQYHLSLHISYPNESDRKRARELGVSPGGDIMIHGIKNGFSWVGDSHAEVDWTKGCIALTDEEIEEIYKFVPVGTMVEIRP